VVAAVTAINWYGASATEPVGQSAQDSTGIIFNREDSKAGTSVNAGVPIPMATSTLYSWPKLVALVVTAIGDTNIANRRFSLSGALPLGVHWFVRGLAAYVQPAPFADNLTTNGALPSDGGAAFSEASPTNTPVYDAASVSTAATGRNGGFCQMLAGLDGTYQSSGGVAGTIPLPPYRLMYDEA
jgi:hypothetical protein